MSDPTLTRTTRRAGGRIADAVAIVTFLCCVGMVARHTRSLVRTDDAGAYQAEVRRSVNAMPREVGEWVGIDVPVPTQAQQLLRPTAFLSRQYFNRSTGESCIVTIIHCGDARDMLDHYPPNCYPGQGWILNTSTPIDVPTSFGTVHATEYEFARGRFGASSLANVTNAMLLPNGRSDPDMAGVERMMGSPTLRFYGVAQMQVFFEQAITVSRRREIVRQLVDAHRDCILPIVRQQHLN